MNTTLLLPSIRRTSFSPFLISFGIHGSLILLFILIQTQSKIAPLGAHRRGDPTVIEITSSSHSTQSEKKASATPHKHTQTAPHTQEGIPLIKKEKKPNKKKQPPSKKVADSLNSSQAKTEHPEPPQGKAGFGFRNGTDAAGPLGKRDGQVAGEREHYLFELKTLIEGRKVYPMASKRLGETGRVVVKFEIKRDGEIASVQMKSSARHQRLNEAALDLIKGVGKYKPLPASITGERLSVEIPIEYVLN